MRRLLAVALLAVGLLAIPSGGAPAKTYHPPYALGPTGGDADGFASADPKGRVTVLRAYPAPGPISCPGEGHYATLKVGHKVTAPVRKVTVAYNQTFVDPYVYATVGVRDATGRWIGSKKAPGLTDSGSIVVAVRWDKTVRGPLPGRCSGSSSAPPARMRTSAPSTSPRSPCRDEAH